MNNKYNNFIIETILQKEENIFIYFVFFIPIFEIILFINYYIKIKYLKKDIIQ